MSPCNEENNAICGNLPSSMRPTCPSHLSLFAVMYADKVATPHDFLICSLVCRSDTLLTQKTTLIQSHLYVIFEQSMEQVSTSRILLGDLTMGDHLSPTTEDMR